MGFPDDDTKRQEFDKRRRAKNLALGLTLTVLVVLFYLITVVKFEILIFESWTNSFDRSEDANTGISTSHLSPDSAIQSI